MKQIFYNSHICYRSSSYKSFCDIDLRIEHPKQIHFRCKRCASCCGDTKRRVRMILLLRSETNSISKTISKDIQEFSEKIEGYEPYVYQMKKNKDGKCIFLKNNSCSIYEIRPLICRFYPFKLEPKKKVYVFNYTGECRGIGKGNLLGKSFYEKLFRNFVERMK